MERPEVIDPLKEEEQPIVQQTPVEEPTPVETQTDDAFSVRGLAEKRFGEIGTSALDFVPIVGDVLAAGDVVESARKGDVLGTAVNVAALGVGLVPIVGDLAAKGLKQGLKKYEKVSTTNKDVIDTPVKDAAEIGDPAEVIALKGANTKFLSNQKKIDKGEKVFDGKTVIDKDKEVFKTFDKLFEEAKIANPEKSDKVVSWEIQSKINQEGYRKETGIDVVSRTEPLEKAALKYYDKVEKGGDPVEARLEYLEILEKLKPIREWDDIPLLTSPKQQVLGLNSAQRKSGKFIDIPNKDAKELEKILGHPLDVIKLNKGQIIEGRLDISAYKTYNAWITALSGTGIKGQIYGDALHYVSPEGGKVIFKAREELARNILTRQPLKVDPDTGEVIRYYDKTPFGVIRGAYNPMSPKDIRQKVKKLLKDPEWTQVGFDPRRLTTFYTRSNRDKYDVGSLVESADEVFQIGPLVLAKNIKLVDQAAKPRLNKGGAIKTYKEGGVVPMQEQMKFAFMNEGGVLADDGVERDPVSGNEVPAGSMAEEVRDDVPAMLSEGEYVVPADVVRFHGIDKFEELRDEAKMGLARMEADGRIGGQPVEQQEEFPFPVEELEGFQEGGVVGDTYASVTGSDFKANQPYGAGGGRFPGVGFELRNFTNPKTGRTVVIPFFNAQPMQYIPPDFLEGGATTTQGGTVDPTAGETDRQESEAQAARGSNIDGIVRDAVDQAMGKGRPTTAATGKSFDQYTSEDWNNYIKNADSKTADVTAKLPVVGLLQRMSEKAARSFAKTALRSGTNPSTEQPLSTEEKLTLERVLMVAPNTSMTESIINAVTGRGETIQGLPLTEQAGFEFGKPVREGDTMVKPVTKLPDDLLPDLSKFKQGEPTDTSKTKAADTTITEQDLPFFPTPAPDFVTQVGGTAASTQQADTQRDQLTSSKARKDSRGTKAQPFMSAAAQIASGNVKEGLFYNPGNIEIGQNYAGEIGTYADGRFAQFSAPQFGVRALAVDMKTKADRYNNNVESMLLEYLGGGRTGSRTSRYKKAEIENPNARTYINNAIKAVGSKRIDTSNVKQMKGLVEQIIRNENTKEIADFYLDQPNVIEEGIVLSQKSFPKETQLADARKALSGELFQAGLVRQPPATPVGLGQTAVAQQQAPTFDRPQTLGVPFTPPVQQPKPVADRPQTLGVPFTPPAIDTDDMLKQAAQNIPAGSDIGGTTPEYFGPPGFQNIIQPQVTTPKLDVGVPQSNLPFVQGPPVAPTVGAPAVSPVTMQDMQTQEAFGIGPGVAPPVVSEPGGLGQVAATSGTLPQVGATAPQPVAPFTPLGKPSDIAKLMPSTADVQAQQAAEARKAREEQERKIYEETQKRIPTEVEPPTPKLETLKASSQTRDAAIAQTARRNAESAARDAGASLSESVDAGLRAEAEANLQRAAERNRKLNQRVDADTAAKQGGYQFRTLTSVLEEEESNDSGGGSGGGGFGGGSPGGGGDDKIVCTEMYRQTQLVDWQKAMKIWDVYQRRYLTPEHQIGYHWLFKPYVKGMQNNRLLTKLGAILAKKRTQHLKHILTKGKAKDDLVGKLWCSIIHPIVHKAGKIKNFLDGKTKAT
jgi:hypothetical protein